MPIEATFSALAGCRFTCVNRGLIEMNGIIYLVGLVVVIMAILSFFGLR